MAKKKPKLDWGPMGAAAIPKALMAHSDYRELSGSARKVLDLLTYQYNGRNNGNLAATHTMMADWGGMAKGTLASALRELVDRNLIVKSRGHDRSKDGAKPALYALSWNAVDECPGKHLELAPTTTAKRKLAC